MNALQLALQHYLEVRRALGFELRTPASTLRTFVAFLEEQRACHVTTALAVQWAKQPPDGDPANWARRLGMVRQFAAWQRTIDPRTEVPPHGLIPHRQRRKAPYIYSDAEIARLLRAARELHSTVGLRRHTHATVIGLLAVTGMRISEVVALDRKDVDLDAAALTIRRGKFRKARWLPLHVSTRDALRSYASVRDRLVSVTTTPAFFVGERGSRITGWAIRYNFAQISRHIGLRTRDGGRHGSGPRIHDLRHRFAVQTLVRWYRSGLEVERELPKLSTYLGHVHFNDTYWYIEAVPELLQLATERVVARRREVSP